MLYLIQDKRKVVHNDNLNRQKQMDEAQKQAAMGMTCKCGSGKTYGECCGNQPCACGSEKMDKDCCMTNAPAAETPAV